MRTSLAILALAPLLAGCISLLPKQPPPPRIYVLEAAPARGDGAAVKPIVLAVDEPTTARALNGSDIAWTKDGVLAYMSGAAWAGRAPDLLQTVLLHTIDRGGLVTGAVRAGAGRADAEIVWDVTAFGVNEDRALEARLAGRAKLFAARNRLMLGSLEFDERVPLRDRTARSAAAALQEATRNASAKIAAWAAEATPVSARGPTRGEGELSGEPAPNQP